MPASAESFDFVIVGAGSAGCAMAARLSEDGAHSVAVLEAGGSDRSVFIQMPSALSIPMNSPKYDWGYETEPEPHLGGRRLHCPRGKVIGGSSSINGMVYVRGNALDFDEWEDEGAAGWGYRNVLPYFRRVETRADGGNEWRGSDGPLHTAYGTLDNPLYRAFIDAAAQAGYAETDDINGFRAGRLRPDGPDDPQGPSLDCRQRLSEAGNQAAQPVPDLAFPCRDGSSSRAGVRLASHTGRRPGGAERIIRARREVILAAGSITSPLLLMRSGIGPGGDLAKLDIPVLIDRPGVGGNLQDHLEFYFQMESKKPITLYSVMNPVSKALIGMRWLALRNGLGATNHFESCGFIRSRAGVKWPDIQYHFLPAAIAYDGNSRVDGHGFQAHVGPMRSKSRGSVRLASTDPFDKPRIRFNYMSHEDDWAEMRAGVRLTREIFAQPAFDPYRGRELQPGAEIVSDEAIDAFIRERVESAYHPCGTCRIGRADDPLAVVDPELRVIGIEGLRIADTSVIPTITTGNLNAPAIMIGEKASDMILGRPPLPASNAPSYVAPDWETKQR